MVQNHKISNILILLFILWLTGVFGYMTIEGWNFLDAAYMTIISLTTTGYGEIHPLSNNGKIFTIALLVMGVSLFVYAVGSLAEAAIEGHFGGIFKKRKMQKIINKLSQHFIICGFGRIGSTIAENLKHAGVTVVVIENSPEVTTKIEKADFLYVEGDATREEVLKNAGLDRARGIIGVLPSDSDNVYVTLTARSLNPGLLIVAMARDATAEKRMVQAGANRVFSPYEIGARRMALAVLKPSVIEFIDLAIHARDFNLLIEQVEIADDSILNGKSIKEIDLRKKTGITLLAVQKSMENMIASPSPDYVLESGDIAIVLGDNMALIKFKELAQGNSP